MPGYVATARLTGVPIAPGSALRADRHDGQAAWAWAIDGDVEVGARITPQASWEDRLHYFREAWAQTTFFLFDPESWR